MRTHNLRLALMGATALSLGSTLATPALAQSGDGQFRGLEEIIVTAQKRAQNIQDVPIAVTALSVEMLEANRVVDVSDLSGLAPGLTVAPTAGGSRIPSFAMRGALSTGLVPGSDKQISIYLDGVAISSPRGSIFDLPDVERIEVLRGPQGTLFGRNATAGAVSISTRDPSGEAGVKAAVSTGNYDQHRFSIGVDLPQMGAFSGYLSYVNSYKEGDIRNMASGVVWDRTNSLTKQVASVDRSPKRLGTKDSESWFAAIKFESGDFTTVYKYDRTEDDGTPDGTGFVGYDASVPLLGDFLTRLLQTQSYDVPMTPSGKRPSSVANGWTVPSSLDVEGHNLTSTYEFSDSLTLKNVFAYRESSIFAAQPLDGFSSLVITPQSIEPFAILSAYSVNPTLALADPATQAAVIGAYANGLLPYVGSPFLGVVTQALSRSEQTSDELQLNYQSDFLTAIVGALWFESEDWSAEHHFENTIAFTPVFNGVLTNTNIGENYNKAKSTAAYAQLEFHVTDQVDIVAGARITKDKKSGTFTFGPDENNLTVTSFDYEKTRPSYLIGVNYKPNTDTLVYGKYSTAFVSGGSVAGLEFEPETAESWEAGIKADFLDNTLRTNLALFQAEYSHVQGPQSPTTPGTPEMIEAVTGDPNLATYIGTFVGDQGDLEAKGFELDVSAAPLDGLTLGGSIGYTDSKFTSVNPALLIGTTGSLERIFSPEWAGSVWAQYDTSTFGGDMYLTYRVDGRWQSDMNMAQHPDRPEYQTFAAAIQEVPSYWVFNGRMALNNIDIGGVNTQLALWGKNLTNEKAANYALDLGVIAGANYIPARTYGLDLSVEF